MLINGDITFTTNTDMANKLAISDPKCKILILSDNVQQGIIMEQQNSIAYLLPSFAILEAEQTNGNDLYKSMYYSHLNSKESRTYFMLIICLLYNGYNVVLYMPDEEASMMNDYIDIFFGFVFNNYGISIGITNPDNQTQSGFNIEFTDSILYEGYMIHGYFRAIDVANNIRYDIRDQQFAESLCKDLSLNYSNPIISINNYLRHIRTSNSNTPNSAPFRIVL